MVVFHATIVPMNACTMPKLLIAILAAGFSSRLGISKPLARVRGVSLLRSTLAKVAPLKTGTIVVVSPRNAVRFSYEARGFKVAFVTNLQRASGMSSSVKCAVRLARFSKALLLLPVDLPNLREEDLARLIRHWHASPRRVVARRLGLSGGTPLIIPRWLYPMATQLRGDMGLRDVLGALPSHQRTYLDLPRAATDIDTPRDLQAARRSLRPI
jgi:molybdenum cofactor cytidylyltransferase